VEILIATDDDDPSDYATALRGTVKHYAGPRCKTLGLCIDGLATKASGNLLFFLGDDHTIEAPDWPDRIVNTAARLPNGIGVIYPRCKFHIGFPSLPIISRRVYEHLNYYMEPYFPFWFIDNWWDEIGEMLGAKIEIDLDVILPEGKGDTHGIVDIAFWGECFELTRMMRVRDTLKLADVAYSAGPQFNDFTAALPRRHRICVRKNEHYRNPDFAAIWEKRSAGPPSKRYAEAKLEAEALMRRLRVDLGVGSDLNTPFTRNSSCPCGSGKRYKHCHGGFRESSKQSTAALADTLSHVPYAPSRHDGD